MKKRVIIVFSVIPFLLGFVVAYLQQKPIGQGMTSYQLSNIQSSDLITLSSNGDIYQLSKNASTQITHGQKLIEPVVVGDSFVAIEKTTNYASLLMFNAEGNLTETVFNGNTGNVDTMNWISDPAVDTTGKEILYVSDRERVKTNVPDNTLYLMNFPEGTSHTIAQPDPYSGGLTHPTFYPTDNSLVFYNYYQYDPQTLVPYSTIEQIDTTSNTTTTLTFEKQNAYQEAFSPDGRQMLFLGRNIGTNNATLYVANFDRVNGLSNVHALLTGDIAYPTFSYTKNHIYFLEAQENSGYDLLTATIQKNNISHMEEVVSGETLLGNSSYEVTQSKK